jgi:hypothetical protein
MHPALILQLERMIGEFARWRAVPAEERSPAPAWWWGPAMELRGISERLPVEWCSQLGLPDGATYAESAEVFFGEFAGQTSLPWPYDFPRTHHVPDPAVRELHPQPSDDSAFQP